MTAEHSGPLRLTDNDQAHLGFILLAGAGYPADAATFEGDCIVMPLPRDPALFSSEAYLLLAEHKDAGEHRYRMRRDAGVRTFAISGSLTRKLSVVVGADGWGDWSVEADGQKRRRMGHVEALTPPAR